MYASVGVSVLVFDEQIETYISFFFKNWSTQSSATYNINGKNKNTVSHII